MEHTFGVRRGMIMWAYHAVAVVFVGLIIAACNDSRSATSRVEQHGLIIEFSPVCVDREVKLQGEIVNTGTQSIQIESGAHSMAIRSAGNGFPS